MTTNCPSCGTMLANQTTKSYRVDLSTRTDAVEVLSSMHDVLNIYDLVTVSDVCDLIGVQSKYADSKHGWRNICGAKIVRDDGGCSIMLPQPLFIV